MSVLSELRREFPGARWWYNRRAVAWENSMGWFVVLHRGRYHRSDTGAYLPRIRSIVSKP